MFPLRDSTPSRTIPIVNLLIIGVNVLVFLFEVSLGQGLDQFVNTMGLMPGRFLQDPSVGQIFTIFSSMFMHGGWMHLISNMWALYIFGDNLEDQMGHFKYLVFYILSGIGAAATQIMAGTTSMIPMVGASGAIAGVLGGYLLMFPHARVTTLLIMGYFSRITDIPALFYLGFWFLSQFFTGMFSLTRESEAASEGGVAWWAHVGGFIVGLILVKIFARSDRESDTVYGDWQ